MNDPRTSDGPAEAAPRAPFVLSVGVTGHRREAIDGGGLAGLEQRVGSVLSRLAVQARALQAEQPHLFAPAEARFLFVSPLADGADQLAARAALGVGGELHAIQPIPRAA